MATFRIWVFWIVGTLVVKSVDAWGGVKIMIMCMYFHLNLFLPFGFCGCLVYRAVENLGQCPSI